MPSPTSTRYARYAIAAALVLAAAIGLALALNPQRRARVGLERGKLYLRQGRLPEALAEFTRSQALAPPAWEAQYYQGKVFAATGKGADAVTLWRGLRASPLGRRALAAAAEQARLDGDRVVALEICADGKADGHSPVPFLAVEARILNADGDLPEAVARYREALTLNPLRTDLATELSQAFVTAQQWAEAQATLELALSANPSTTALEVQLAEVFKRQERYPEAYALYQQIVAREPDLTAARVALLEHMVLAGDWTAAEAEANTLLDHPGAGGLAHFVLGQVAYRQGVYRDALEQLQLAKVSMPEDVRVLQWLGRAMIKRGDVTGGVASLRSAAQHLPDDLPLQMELLHALWDTGDYAAAHEMARDFPVEPTDPEDRGFVRMVRTSSAHRLADLDIPALINRAQTALQAGRLAEARQAALLVQRRLPEDPRPFVILALVALQRQDMRSALGFLHEGWVRAPGNAAVAINRARVLHGVGQPGLALATLTDALAAEGAEVAALVLETAPLLVAQGRTADAEQLIRTQGGSPLPAPLAVALGEALLLQNRPDEALMAVQDTVAREGRLCQLRALLTLRRDDEARALLATLRSETPARPKHGRAALDELGALLFSAEAASSRGRVADHPLARAAALARGRTDVRHHVAQAAGRAGALLGLVALVESNAKDDAAAWHGAHFAGTPALTAEALPAKPRAYRTALVCQLMGWPAAAMRFYADAGATAHPLLLEPMIACALRLGRPDQALRLADAVTAAAPTVERAWVQSVTLLRRRGDISQAAALLERAVAALPQSALLLALAGEVAQEDGRRAEAVAQYRAAIAAGAGPGARNALAWLLLEDDATAKEALELATVAREAAPFAPEVADTLARCYLKADQPDQAVYFSNLAVLLNPSDPRLRAQRAEALVAGGWLQAALEDCHALQRQVSQVDSAAGDLLRVCVEIGA